jgi:hypothetical protein
MRLAVVCVLATMMGCSVITVDRSTVPQSDGTLGCTTSHASVVADAAIIAGGALLLNDARNCAEDAECHGNWADEWFEGGLVAAVGLASALVGQHWIGACERAVEEQRITLEQERASHDRAEQQERAWRLTVEAEAAARAGNCARVAELDPQIAAIDTGMHDVVFARDLGVIRCRGSAL